jgi:hypothetical protein
MPKDFWFNLQLPLSQNKETISKREIIKTSNQPGIVTYAVIPILKGVDFEAYNL